MQSKFTKKFLLWFVIFSIILVPWFIISAIATNEGGIVTTILFALFAAALFAVVPAIFHRWFREVRHKHIPTSDKTIQNKKQALTAMEYLKIQKTKQYLVWGITLFMFYPPIILVTGKLLNFIGIISDETVDGLAFHMFIFIGTFIFGVIGLIAVSVAFSGKERIHGTKESIPKYDIWNVPGRMLLIFLLIMLAMFMLSGNTNSSNTSDTSGAIKSMSL